MTSAPWCVSVVVPVRNGAPWLRSAITAIADQAAPPLEIIVVDDGSEDGSVAILAELAKTVPLRILGGPRRGAAAALNAGFAAARGDVVCQIDQDVTLEPGWISRLCEAFADPTVGAVQGYYASDRGAGVWSRVMALDLEQRYQAMRGDETTHVCTGNAAYRAEAVRAVGGFDETLGYGYDNDMSYRMRAAGYRLLIRRDARSRHAWRDSFAGYCQQQYGFGYGRLDLVARHPRRLAGDSVSPWPMMLHPLVMLAAVLCLGGAGLAAAINGPWRTLLAAAGLLAGALTAERAVAGTRAAIRFRDPAALLFPIVHAVRDLAWVGAIAAWCARRLTGRGSRPADSMKARAHAGSANCELGIVNCELRTIVLIPAHNEADSLPAVVAELRQACPRLDLLVIDDGSTDGTAALLPRLNVRYLQLSERLGVGNAMRAGLAYAARVGYDTVVRIDGDGQHRADAVAGLLAPLTCGDADVVIGSRFIGGPSQPGVVRAVQRALGWCLSALIGVRVTDPTSGFYALGPRAVRVLAMHHPTGYPEPELRLLLGRSGLTVLERAVGARSRLGGRTSLTAPRLAAAAARVLLALVVVPLRTASRVPR